MTTKRMSGIPPNPPALDDRRGGQGAAGDGAGRAAEVAGGRREDVPRPRRLPLGGPGGGRETRFIAFGDPVRLTRWTIRFSPLWREIRAFCEWLERHAFVLARDAEINHLVLRVDEDSIRLDPQAERIMGAVRRGDDAPGGAGDPPACPRLAAMLPRHGVRRMRLDCRLESNQVADALVLLVALRRHLGPDGPGDDNPTARRVFGPTPVQYEGTQLHVIDGRLEILYSYRPSRLSKAVQWFARRAGRHRDHRAFFAAAPRAGVLMAALAAVLFTVVVVFDKWWPRLALAVVAAGALSGLTYLFFKAVGSLAYDNEEKARRLARAALGLRRYADRTRQDLLRARHIQHQLLPDLSRVTCDGRVEWASKFLPEAEVGGDYFDVARLGPDRLAILFADVSGHGMAAALITTILKTGFQAWTDDGGHIEEFVRRTNRNLLRLTPVGNFAALFVATYNAATGRLTYINCGHCPEPWLIRAAAAGTVIQLSDARALVLGVEEDIGLRRAAVDLAAGDRVVFATDGVVEARDAADGMYTAERFARLLEGLRDVPVGTLVERAVRDVQRFAQDRQLDDRTVLAMHVNRVDGEK